MKRLILPTLTLLLAAATALAVPARRGSRSLIQSDGSAVTVTLRGDEFGHSYFTEDGLPLMRDDAGDFYYTELDAAGLPRRSSVRATDARGAAERRFIAALDRSRIASALTAQRKDSPLLSRANATRGLTPRRAASSSNSSVGVGLFPGNAFPDKGSPRVLVVLVRFADQAFMYSDAATYLPAMFTQQGFSQSGATGSALDYFSAASNGLFTPQFDVYGPVTLPNNMAYYGANNSYGNDTRPHYMAIHACDILDAAPYNVDFSIYDTDNDGYIDNVYILYAGYGENYTGAPANCVWPHASSVKSDWRVTKRYDGKYLDDYACSNEYMYGRNKPESIGTFCHEFSHVAGLPDLYDIDYEENDDCQTITPGEYDLMDQGSYNNDGRTPPTYSIFERNAHGWADIDVLTTGDAREVTLQEIQTSNRGCMVKTSSDNEFFLMENRQKTKWDAYLPGHGMLIWHIAYDSSVWNANSPNTVYAKQRVDIEEAGGTANNGSSSVMARYPFPGTARKTSFTDDTTPNMKTWSGTSLGVPLTDIKESNGDVTFNVCGGPPSGVSLPESNATGDRYLNNAFTWTLTKKVSADRLYYQIIQGDDFEELEYTGPVTIDRDALIEYWAERDGQESVHGELNLFFSTATPSITPASGTLGQAPVVAITSATTDAVIRYTLDGSTPTASSTLYTAPFTPTGNNITVKARAFRSPWEPSDVATATYTVLDLSDVEFSDVYELVTDASSLVHGDRVIIVAADYDVAMSTVQNTNNRGQQSITKNTTNKTITVTSDVVQTFLLESVSGGFRFNNGVNGYLYAASSSYNYLRTTTSPDANATAKITVTPAGVATIAFQGTNTHNTLYYNKNSSIFSCYSSAQQNISLYKARIIDPDAVTVNPPTSNLGTATSKACTADFSLTLTKDNDADAVYYTIAYTDGTSVAKTQYTGAVTIAKGCTVEFWAERGGKSSEHVTVTFTFTVQPPTISPNGYSGKKMPTVTLACPTSGAAIRYTLDGTDPTTSSTLYTAPFTPTGDNVTVKARAFRDGWTQSAVVSAVFTITQEPVATGNVFVKVTSADELLDGMDVIIVNEANNKAMSKTQGNNNRPATNVTITDGRIEVGADSEVQILTLKAATTTGTSPINGFAFSTGEGYLCAASSSNNYLKTSKTIDNNAIATISFSGTNKDAVITFQGNYSRKIIRYNANNGSPLFSCYSSGQNPVQLYKRQVTAFTDLADVTALEDGSRFNLDTMLEVVFSSGEYVYVYDIDNFNYGLIIATDTGFLPGDVIDHTWSGTVNVVDGQPRVIPDGTLTRLDESMTETPFPLEVSAANVGETLTAAAAARPVRLYNVAFLESLPTSAEKTLNVYLTTESSNAIRRVAQLADGVATPTVTLRNVFDRTANVSEKQVVVYEWVDGMANIAGQGIEVYPTDFSSKNTTVTGLDTISADADDEKYYDLHGRRVTNPTPGFYIRLRNGYAEKTVIR